jgi:hypothetical protein
VPWAAQPAVNRRWRTSGSRTTAGTSQRQALLGGLAQAGRADQRGPDLEFEVVHAGFAQRRQLGRQRAAATGQADGLELAGLDLRQRQPGRHQRQLDLALDQRRQHRRVAVVGHVHGVEAAGRLFRYSMPRWPTEPMPTEP